MQTNADLEAQELENGMTGTISEKRALPAIDTRQRLVLWFLPAIALGISFVLAHTHLHGPTCIFRAALHLPCPGCGLTRSFNAIWHGDLITSFRFHPLGLPLFTLFAVYVLSTLLWRKFPLARRVSNALTQASQEARIWKIATALLLGVWVGRLCLIFAGNRYFLW